MSWDVRVGDALDVLRTLPDASVDALVTDCPAAISFMGRTWDSDKGGRDAWIDWLSTILQEACRVMKPGAHAVIWALPRTSGWTHRAIEDAGLDVRDCLTHLFSTGFPKSLDFAAVPGPGLKRIVRPEFIGTPFEDGWGTACKPAAEFWYLARKPLIGTIAANVASFGTGGLNIDGCRVATSTSDATHMERCNSPNSGRVHPRVYAEATQADGGRDPNNWTPRHHDTTQGRWPPNLLLSHIAPDVYGNGGCVRTGVKRVKGGTKVAHSLNGPSTAQHTDGGYGYTTTSAVTGYADPDGTEEVPSWDCARDPETGVFVCPVALLDEQAGERKSGSGEVKVSAGRKSGQGTWAQDHGMQRTGTVNVGIRDFGDAGGPSRFFPVFEPDPAPPTVGRWPPNLLLSHIAPDVYGNGGCVRTGTKRVKGGSRPIQRPNGFERFNGQDYNNGKLYVTGAYESPGYADADGTEEVAAYSCEPNCPVRLLDEQAGERKTGGPQSGKRYDDQPAGWGGGTNSIRGEGDATRTVSGYTDQGGCSRFFPVFDGEPTFAPDPAPLPVDEPDFVPWLYNPKASRRERNCGLDGMPERNAGVMDGRNRDARPNHRGLNEDGSFVRAANDHPTVKSVALCRWLVRLVTPPNGTVLDCFMGSGSVGMAAVLEGFDFIGIDQDEHYVNDIARHRIAHVERHGENWLKAAGAATYGGKRVYGGKGTNGFGDTLRRCPEHGASFPSGSNAYACGCPAVRVPPVDVNTGRTDGDAVAVMRGDAAVVGSSPTAPPMNGVYGGGKGRYSVARCPEHDERQETRTGMYLCGCRIVYHASRQTDSSPTAPPSLTDLPLFAVAGND